MKGGDVLLESQNSIFPVLELFKTKRGEKQALVGAIPFCGEYPDPRFEDKFQSANQMDVISKAGGDKMAAS